MAFTSKVYEGFPAILVSRAARDLPQLPGVRLCEWPVGMPRRLGDLYLFPTLVALQRAIPARDDLDLRPAGLATPGILSADVVEGRYVVALEARLDETVVVAVIERAAAQLDAGAPGVREAVALLCGGGVPAEEMPAQTTRGRIPAKRRLQALADCCTGASAEQVEHYHRMLADAGLRDCGACGAKLSMADHVAPPPDPPVGQHEWSKGFHGMRGQCSRCGARASLAMNGQCEWRPRELQPSLEGASER